MGFGCPNDSENFSQYRFALAAYGLGFSKKKYTYSKVYSQCERSDSTMHFAVS